MSDRGLVALEDERTRRAWVALAWAFMTPEDLGSRVKLAKALGRSPLTLADAARSMIESGLDERQIEAIFKFDVVPAFDRKRGPGLDDDQAVVDWIARRSTRSLPGLARTTLWRLASPSAKVAWRLLSGAVFEQLHGAERAARVVGLLNIKTPVGRRNRAWVELSRLFVDGDFDDRDVAAMAKELGTLGFDVAELDRMFTHEVAPVCDWGFTTIGPWPSFEPEALVAAIERRRLHPPPRLSRMLEPRFITRAVRPLWVQVRAEMER